MDIGMSESRLACDAGDVEGTDGSLVGTFLHQAEELLRGAVVTVLLVQLFHRGQQLVDDGLQLGAADGLWRGRGEQAR